MNKYTNLPNLLIIGAPKAGTTSLYNYLAGGSEQIYFPEIKEPHFFVHKYVKNKFPICKDNWDDYVKLFSGAGNCRIIGEASVFYFYYDTYTIQQIKKYLGDDLFIILIIRNPVDRAYSAYKYTLALNKDENLSFSQAIDAEKSRIEENIVSPMLFYVSCGMYAERLEHWKNAFSQFKVVVFDDFTADPQQTLSEIFNFLGVGNASRGNCTKKYNAGFGSEWRNPFLGKCIKKIASRSVRDLSHKFFPAGYQYVKNKLLHAAMKKTAISPEDKIRLIDIFSDDVEKTSKIIGRDLSSWLC